MRVGLLGGLAAGADLVVSGINHGANLADDVNYSGTVGAGLEAAILGTPSVCLSQQTPPGSFSVNYQEDLAASGLAYDFGFAARHGADLRPLGGRGPSCRADGAQRQLSRRTRRWDDHRADPGRTA